MGGTVRFPSAISGTVRHDEGCRQSRDCKAMRTLVAEYGRLRARREWESAAPGRPSTRTIDRRWGWQELIAEASGRSLDQVLTRSATVVDASCS
jgi:hypothetical protein